MSFTQNTAPFLFRALLCLSVCFLSSCGYEPKSVPAVDQWIAPEHVNDNYVPPVQPALQPGQFDPELLDGTSHYSYAEDEAKGKSTRNYNTGKTTTSVYQEAVPRAAEALPDGKLLLAGRIHAPTTANNFALFRYRPDGSFDRDFGSLNNGIAEWNVWFANKDDMAHDFRHDTRGRIVAAGRTHNNSYFNMAVSRFLSDGDLDTTFGSAGSAVVTFNTLNAVARSVALQIDDKVLVGGYVARNGPLHTQYDMAVFRLTTRGELDTSYDGDGFNTASIGTNRDDVIYGVAIDPITGKLVVGGYSFNGTIRTALGRFLTNGTIDSAFEGDGVVELDFATAGIDLCNAVAVTSSSHVVCAGYSVTGGNTDMLIARFQTNGQLDTTAFGTNGRVMIDFGGNREDVARAVHIQPDNKLLVAGWHYNGTNYDFAITRLLSNGQIDTTGWGVNGRVTTSIGTRDDAGLSVHYDDGAIYVAGRALFSFFQIGVARYETDGSLASSGTLDLTWNNSGRLSQSISSLNDIAYSGAQLPDGKLILGGTTNDNIGTARFHTDGRLDSSWGVDGRVITTIGIDGTEGYAVAVQNDGKIIVGGRTNGLNQNLVFARLTTAGILDPSFNSIGYMVTTVGTGNEAIKALGMQVDGKVVGAGYTFNTVSVSSNYDFLVVRLNTDGSLDTTNFNGRGVVTVSIRSQNDFGAALALQTDGKIVVGGYTFNGTNDDFALTRINTNGSIDTATFGVNGRVVTSIFSSTDIIHAITVDNQSFIVAAGRTWTARGNNDIAAVRYRTDGAIDSSFSGDGIVTVSILTSHDVATAVLMMPDQRIMLAGHTGSGTNHQFAMVRLNTNGNLDSTFGGTGYIVASILSSDDDINALFFNHRGKMIGAGRTHNGTNNDFAVLRLWP